MNNYEKSQPTKENKIKSGWKLVFVIGLSLMLIGIAFFLYPNFNEINSISAHGRLSSAHSNHIMLNGLQWNFITHTSPQELYITYTMSTTENKDGFIAFFIPYSGTLERGIDWRIQSFPETGGTLLYKKYTCTTESPCKSDQDVIVFHIQGNLNAYRYFKNYIQIQVDNNPVHSEAIDLINKLAGKPNFNFGWSENTTPILKITLPSDADEWKERPTSGSEIFTKKDGTNFNVLKWRVEGNTLIQVEYTAATDRLLSQNNIAFMAVFLTLGAAALISSFESKRSIQSIGYLRSALTETETKINDTLRGIKGIVDDEQQTKKRKTEEENRVYKISLLHDLDGIVMSIYQTLNQAKTKDDEEKIIKTDLKKIIEYHSEEYKYWADRITSINANTYVPAQIRSTVSMLLHQGIKPIYSPEMALEYDFLEKTFLNLLDKILVSDYITKDSDSNVQKFVENVKTARGLLTTLTSNKS